MNIGYDIG